MNRKKKDILQGENLWDYAMLETKKIYKKKIYQKNNVSVNDKAKIKIQDKTEVSISEIKNTKAEDKKYQISYSDIDKNRLNKLKKGQLRIDNILDLHGLSKQNAYQKFKFFIDENYKNGSRILLVITGKGNHEKNLFSLNNNDFNTTTIGVLRSSLPEWLEESYFKLKIISHKVAYKRHGGEGARYIILKKRKEIKKFIK